MDEILWCDHLHRKLLVDNVDQNGESFFYYCISIHIPTHCGLG